MKQHAQLIVVGGGPAGLAAAVQAHDDGIEDILIIERDNELGGILNQCIHTGFGVHIFGQELTGPEYALNFRAQVEERGIRCLLGAMALRLGERSVVVTGRNCGLVEITCDALVLAMGCRERARGAVGILGSRPSGIFTAGAAQRFLNREGYMVGREAVVLGSGDIGLIMARRMTLEGAHIKMVCEIEPYSNGLTRNIVQCLDDFGIPLRLSHTVTSVEGRGRLSGVTVARVDGQRQPIPGTEEHIPCDTLLLSVGLIPENELSRAAGLGMDGVTAGPLVNEAMQTSAGWIFACGNVVHVHDLVDFVTLESRRAGTAAARYIASGGSLPRGRPVPTRGGSGVRYVVPQTVWAGALEQAVPLYFRVAAPCRDAVVELRCNGRVLASARKRRLAPGEMESIQLTPALSAVLTDVEDPVLEIAVV